MILILFVNRRCGIVVLIARASEGVAEAAAYAEEGIIHQHLAQKALDIFKTRLTSLQSYPCRKDN